MTEPEVASEFRRRLVERLKRAGYIRSEAVEQAMLTVPRHLFAPPGVSVEEAYEDEVISLVPGLATLSQPSIVALMLEELGARPGLKTLEIGTASGYNAALLAEIVGDGALVCTIEIDRSLSRQAARNLAAAGYEAVRTRAGDGALGWPEEAPFARIIVTAEATDLSPNLLEQLDETGVLLAPFSAPALPALLLRLSRDAAAIHGGFVGIPVAFVPLRGQYGQAPGEVFDGVRRTLWAVQHRVWENGAALTLDQRLTLDLVAVALAEGAESPAEQLASRAWEAYLDAGQPDLAEVRVTVRPLAECLPTALALRRRAHAFCLELPGQRIPAGGGESSSQEGL